MTREEMESIWFTQIDYKCIKTGIRYALIKIERGRGKIEDMRGVCQRGLGKLCLIYGHHKSKEIANRSNYHLVSQSVELKRDVQHERQADGTLLPL
jgi:hypothetical protein